MYRDDPRVTLRRTLIPSWGPHLLALSSPNYLPESPLPNTITQWSRVSSYEFWGKEKNPKASRLPFNLQMRCPLLPPWGSASLPAACFSLTLSPDTGISPPWEGLLLGPAQPPCTRGSAWWTMNRGGSEKHTVYVRQQTGCLVACGPQEIIDCGSVSFCIFFHEICRFTFIFPHDISSATLNNSILFEYFHFKMCPGVITWRNTFADENSLVYADPSLGPSEQPSPNAVFLNTDVLTFCATLIKQWGLFK